jgi:hypothetical protein
MGRQRPTAPAAPDGALPPDPFWQVLLVSPRALGGALVIAAAILAGHVSWDAARDDTRFEGQPVVSAVVVGIDRRVTGRRGASTSYARYRFDLPDGHAMAGEDRLPASEQSEVTRAGRARVQYLREDPARNRLYFSWMTASTASRANRVMAALVLVLMGTGAWLFMTGWRRARRAWAQQARTGP